MSWKIANAKQQFSEVVRLCAKEPQAIYNREKCVAVLVSAEQFADFERWQASAHTVDLTEQFALVRALLAQAGADGIDLPVRTTRPNALLEALRTDDPG